MQIRNSLRHRAQLSRPTESTATGERLTSWVVVQWRLRCLLTVLGPEEATSPAETQRPQEREGIVYAAPGADIRPGDRLQFVTGTAGVWVVTPDVVTVPGLRGPSHVEARVQAVNAP